jgi:GNAT superfamily N-acetyltransferase
MEFLVVAYDSAVASELIEEVQQEYVVRYGGPDDSAVDPAEFAPPKGLFLVGYDDEAAVVCAGWRSHGTHAEVKRMYVRKAARGRGFARAMLAELERTALAAGHDRMILETGSRQPEAVALYRSAGYTDSTPFGHYADAPLAVHLAKDLHS